MEQYIRSCAQASLWMSLLVWQCSAVSLCQILQHEGVLLRSARCQNSEDKYKRKDTYLAMKEMLMESGIDLKTVISTATGREELWQE